VACWNNYKVRSFARGSIAAHRRRFKAAARKMTGRQAPSRAVLRQDKCSEANNHIIIGKENYFLSGDGYLMPARKDQAPPDLRYFKQKWK
jgi:hypothetical protein